MGDGEGVAVGDRVEVGDGVGVRVGLGDAVGDGVRVAVGFGDGNGVGVVDHSQAVANFPQIPISVLITTICTTPRQEDKAFLLRKYVDEQLSAAEIAKICNVPGLPFSVG